MARATSRWRSPRYCHRTGRSGQRARRANFKYLPATVVDELGLRELGFNASVLLVREEYHYTLDTLEGRQKNSGGIVITGHPGIGTICCRKIILLTYSWHLGKSVFIYYMLLHLLGKGQPVALQCVKKVLIFREDGVEIHEADSGGFFFRTGEKLWSLTDSTEMSTYPCRAFQVASQMRLAWFVLATSPTTKRYDRLRKKCNAGIFVMEYFTLK